MFRFFDSADTRDRLDAADLDVGNIGIQLAFADRDKDLEALASGRGRGETLYNQSE